MSRSGGFAALSAQEAYSRDPPSNPTPIPTAIATKNPINIPTAPPVAPDQRVPIQSPPASPANPNGSSQIVECRQSCNGRNVTRLRAPGPLSPRLSAEDELASAA